MAVVTQTIQDQVSQLYIAYFGRAPESDGFAFWAQSLANGTPVTTAALQMANSFEFRDAYNGLTPTQQVTKLYQNVLNRAPDASGLAYWTNLLNTGTSIGSVAWGIVNSAFQQGTATADGNLVLNKVSVSEYFAVTLGSNDKAVAQTAFNLVTSNPASVAVADAALAQAVAPTYTLTTSIETVPASGVLPLYSTVNGVVNGANGTFQTGDIVNGSGSTNNVNVTIAAASGEANGPLVALNNVGTATFRTLAAAPINAQLFSNVGTIASAGSTNVLTVNNGSAATTYAVANSVANSNDGMAVALSNVAGTATTVNFSVANAGTPATTNAAGPVAAFNTLLSTTVTGIENIALNTTGVNNVQITGNTTAATDSASLVITGSGNNVITIGANGLATTSSISAATATGTLNLNVQGNLSTGDTIVGTAGLTDTLRATVNGVTATGLAVSGFETFRIDSGANNSTLAFTLNPAFSTVRVDATAAGGGAAGTRSLLNAGGYTTINLVGNSTLASTTAANNFSGLTSTAGFTGLADVVAVNVSNGGQTLTAGGSYTVANVLASNGVESYNITVNDTTANAAVVTTFAGITDAFLTGLAATSNTAVALGTITSLGALANTGALTSVNLSGVTGTNAVSTVTIASQSLAAAALITAGAGGLNVTLGAEATTDVVTFTGGVGNDTVTANQAAPNTFNGNLIANGGAGNDTFLIGTAAAGATSAALTGGTGVDTFTFASAAGAAANTITDLGAGAFAIAAGTGRESLSIASGGVTSTVVANFVDTNTQATDTGIIALDTVAASNVFNLGSAVTAFNVSGVTAVGGGAFNAANGVTVNANAAGGATITGTAGIDVLNGGAGIDILVGDAGADTISAGAGATNSITGGTGGDTMTAGAGIDTFVQALADSVAAGAVNLTAGGIAAGNTITFAATGVVSAPDRIVGFQAGAGGDILDLASAGPAQALLGTTVAAGLAAATNYYLSGSYNATTGVFTITANGAGADTLILQGAAAPDNAVATTDSSILLVGVNSANLVAANII